MQTVTHSLVGKVVLITGASSGIGAAAAQAFAHAGCKLMLGAAG
jgi:NADP-dependent 3-hydroxy acid dehydrogenase YdfG